MCGTSAVVVAPGDPLRRRRGLDGGGVVAVEVVPGPGEEGVGLAVRAAEQHRVHAEPGGEGDRALDLVAVLADLGDGGVAADHRHDALVLVAEGLASAAPCSSRRMFCRGPAPGLLGDRAELRQRRRRRRPRDVGDVADGVHAREARARRGRAGRRSGRRAGAAARRPAAIARRRLAAAPDHGPGADRRCRRRARRRSACTAATPVPSRISTPCLGQLLERVRVGLVGERRRAAPRRGRPGGSVPGARRVARLRRSAASARRAPRRSRPRSGRRRRRPTSSASSGACSSPGRLAAAPGGAAAAVRRRRPSTAGRRARPRRGRRRSSACATGGDHQVRPADGVVRRPA